MGSNLKSMTVFMVVLMFAVIIGVVIYVNGDSFGLSKNQDSPVEETQQTAATPKQIGSDTRAFLQDDTFFDADKAPYSSIAKKEGKTLSLLMTSVQKDLRIQVVDNVGKLVTGVNFNVVLNKDKEYIDDDKDGIIYIEYLRAGGYEVVLKEVEGYHVPDTPARIEVKQSVEYAVIDDISLLIFTEEDINPKLEDVEVNGAADDADKTEITKMQAGNPNAKVGIDVSKWNKEIDWDKAKAAGVEFAIIRVGYRGAATGALVVDPYFEKNMEGAIRAGIPVGAYFFTQATNVVEAVEEASMVVSLCGQYDITYPIFIDTEGAGGNGRADGLEMEARTQVCKAFCTTVDNAGYRAGIYGARNWFNQMLDMDSLNNYVIWLAEYRDVPVYQGYYHMWQYTSGGKIDGIEGKVDLNLSYLKIDALPEVETVEPKPIANSTDADW